MKINCNFEPLLSCLSNVSSVVEDALSSEDMKNIIFKVTGSDRRIQLIGLNTIITYKKKLMNGEYLVEAEDTEFNDSDEFFMQIKSKELISFLSAFKTMKRTKAETVEFETIKGKVKATVVETDLDTGDKRSSDWIFDNIPIKPRSISQISLTFPEEGATSVDTQRILFHTESLIPIMQSNGSGMYSKLTFGKDRVIAFNTAFNSLMVNVLPEAFQGINLTYRAVSFMKDIICGVPAVTVNRTEMHLCFETDDSQAFIIYDNKIADYAMYVNLFKKDHGIILDRQYFRDVLKRLSIGNDKIDFKINPEAKVVEVSSSKFHQEVPLLNTKGMDGIGEIKFKIMPEVLNKMIIGDDLVFSNELRMYFVPNTNGSFVFNITDDEEKWFSTASVR